MIIKIFQLAARDVIINFNFTNLCTSILCLNQIEFVCLNLCLTFNVGKRAIVSHDSENVNSSNNLPFNPKIQHKKTNLTC